MTEVFSIAPAATRPLVFLAALGALMLGLLLLFGYVAYSARSTEFAISPDGLSIRRTLYGRTVPWSRLDVDGSTVVDLTSDREWQPTRRTIGVGLPGYRAGWFRLRRGGRALLFVTDRSRVVAVPTLDDYTLLLSVGDPDAFLGSLRRAAERGS